MRSALFRLLGVGKVKLVDDTKQTQVVQLDLGPAPPDGTSEIMQDAYALGPYGLTSNPPTDADAVVIFLDAERSLGVMFGCNFKSGRPTGLQPGEAALFNAVTGAIIKMDVNRRFHANCDGLIDGDLDVAGNGSFGSGATGTFMSAGGQTVTVQDGLITNID